MGIGRASITAICRGTRTRSPWIVYNNKEYCKVLWRNKIYLNEGNSKTSSVSWLCGHSHDFQSHTFLSTKLVSTQQCSWLSLICPERETLNPSLNRVVLDKGNPLTPRLLACTDNLDMGELEKSHCAIDLKSANFGQISETTWLNFPLLDIPSDHGWVSIHTSMCRSVKMLLKNNIFNEPLGQQWHYGRLLIVSLHQLSHHIV